MAFYPRRSFRRFRKNWGRRYRRARFTYRYEMAKGRRSRGARSGGLLNIGYSHKKMLAGAILMLTGIMMFPKFRDWLAETWVKLKLPIK